MQRRLAILLILSLAAACSGSGGSSSATDSAALLQAAEERRGLAHSWKNLCGQSPHDADANRSVERRHVEEGVGHRG